MIIPEKVRSMSKKDQFKYYLEKISDINTPDNLRSDAVEAVSGLMEGVDINDIEKELGVKCTFDQKSVPAQLIFELDNGKSVVFDFVVEDRDQFDGSKPEAKKTIRSFLTPEEKEDIHDQTGVDMK